jgi:hypothetical protein
MFIPRRVLLTIFVAAIAGLSLTLAVGAAGKHPGKAKHQGKRHGAPLIKQTLAPSEPSDPTFHGVEDGDAPWVLRRGELRLKRGGKLNLRVKGLVIPTQPANGTPGLLNTISASLYCGANSTTTAAETSQEVPISRKGNARIRDRSFSVPSTCLAPVILVHPNGDATHYIAVDGWRL